MINIKKLKGVESVIYSRWPYLYILSNVLSTICQTLLPKRQICGLIAEALDFQPSFSSTVIHFLGGIQINPWDSQIVIGYFAPKSTIYLMAVALPYTLTPLSSTISKKGSVGKREELLSRLKSQYNKYGEVAVLKIDWVLVRKQLSYTISIRWLS